jgi:glycosyltransferase involved in cell wall biosynthesis
MQLLFTYGRSPALDPTQGQDVARGGITTALYALTRSLAARGHDVHIVARCNEPGEFEGVWFHDRSTTAELASSIEIDALIAIPDLLPVLLPIPARARVVWTGNAFASGDCVLSAPWRWAPEIGKSGLQARLWMGDVWGPHVDRIVAKSRWQAAHLATTTRVDDIAVIYNGVPLEHYRGPAPERHVRRLVYTSQPRRGLDVLLAVFSAIRSAVPNVELHVFGYDSVDAFDAIPGAVQPGVVYRGRMIKSALADELRRAAVMAYPCTFTETFCTSVAEAQAAGLPVVTRDLGSLAERVTNGVNGEVIAGEPTDPRFREAFANAVITLLGDSTRWRAQSTAAVEHARLSYDWRTIAGQWEDGLSELVTGPPRAPTTPRARDLTTSERLRLEDRGAVGSVPSDTAIRWLCDAWDSYGYDPDELTRARAS